MTGEERQMDYDLDVMLVAQHAFNRFNGGRSTHLGQFAVETFDKYDRHIRDAVAPSGRILSPKERSVIAAMATMTPASSTVEGARLALQVWLGVMV